MAKKNSQIKPLDFRIFEYLNQTILHFAKKNKKIYSS